MHRYRQFDSEFDLNNSNSAAILAEIEIEEPFPFELDPHLNTNLSKLNKLKIFFHRRTLLERYLFYILILLLLALCIVIILSLTYRKKSSISSFCLTPACVEVSHVLAAGMNQSVDPCDDFYEFVCGRWKRTNIIPKGYPSWSTTRALAQKNQIILKTILEQSSIESLFNAEQEAIRYYRSCMNTTELERLSTQPLENYFHTQLNFTFDQWIHIDQNQTWEQLFVRLTKFFSRNHTYAFVLPIKIAADEKNSTWNNIYIDQPALSLGSRDYYIHSMDNQTNVKNQIIRETYGTVGSEILHLLGFEKNASINRMNHIIQFETELALVNLPMEMLQNHDETYHLMSLKQLQGRYQTLGFDMISFFNELFQTNLVQLNENDQMIILNDQLMSNVSNILVHYLLTPSKSHIVIDHFLLSFILTISPYLPSVFERTLLPLRKVLLGTESPPERWEFCVKLTDGAFGYGLGSWSALYIRAAFSESDRLIAKGLIKTLRETFEDNLNKLSWIEETSKVEAKKKLSQIYEKIGYPDFIRNQTKLNERYGGYPMMENTFFDNGIKVINRERRRSLNKYRQKVDRTEWNMTPGTVNAYYSISTNEIVFPAGILQLPFFNKELPIAINYGAIGSVIGHEMTHGFDNQGREFDADGNMRQWWTNSSLAKFEEKSACFIQQYSKFLLDGQRTLGENIADNGGLKLSYFAYDKSKGTTNNHRLPGLNYPNDQLFFIAFAHTWCHIATSNSMHYDLINNPHSSGRFRVIGSVQNSEEFARVFSCKSKSKMNPSDKCQLW